MLDALAEEPLYLLAVLSLDVALAEWLCRRTPLRHLGTALVVIVVTAIVANLGVIPTFSEEIPVYEGIFGFVAPLAIFWLLLGVRLADVLRAGKAMLALFLLGAAGTTVGVLLAMQLVDGEAAFGERFHALGGMFVGTYTGGSVNFNAIALEYGVVKDGALYAGAAAVDSGMTTLWMALNLLVPRLLGARWPGRKGLAAVSKARNEPDLGVEEDSETLHPIDLGWTLALGCAAVVGSELAAARIEAATGWAVPSILVLTTVALVLAQLPFVARLRGTRLLGMYAVYLFLAVIGALCDVEALRSIGALGTSLFLFVGLTLVVHGLVVYGAAFLARVDPVVASVASQANVGGGTTALALARSLGRADLVLPAILVGSLGSALGTYLGFLAAGILGGG